MFVNFEYTYSFVKNQIGVNQKQLIINKSQVIDLSAFGEVTLNNNVTKFVSEIGDNLPITLKLYKVRYGNGLTRPFITYLDESQIQVLIGSKETFELT